MSVDPGYNTGYTALKTKILAYISTAIPDNMQIFEYLNTTEEAPLTEKFIRHCLQVNTDLRSIITSEDQWKNVLNNFNLIRLFIDFCIREYNIDNKANLFQYVSSKKKIEFGTTAVDSQDTNKLYVPIPSIYTTTNHVSNPYNYIASMSQVIDFELLIKDYTITSNETNILKNYIKVILSLEPTNMKSQLYAMKYLFNIFEYYITFTMNCNNVENGTGLDGSTCKYFNEQMVTNVINDDEIDNIYNTSLYLTAQVVKVDTKITLTGETNNSPLVTEFKLVPSSNLQIVLDDGKKYDIKMHSFTVNTTGENQSDFSIELKNDVQQANAIPEGSLSFDLQYKGVTGIFRKKLDDNTKQINDYNINILDSRNKINSIIAKTQVHKDILDSLDKRLIFYYICIAVIFAIYIALVFINKQDIRQYGSILSCIIALLMNLANTFLNNDTIIEKFEESTVNCSDLSDDGQKQAFIASKVTTFNQYIHNLIDQYDQSIQTMDVDELLKKINTMIENEKRVFEGHNDVYDKKSDMNVSNLEILKQEIIERVSFLNLIASVTFIITIVFLMNVIEPKFLKIYGMVAIVFIIFILAKYLMTVTQTVNTKTKNKYWSNIPESTQQQL